jgi:hypothetical protein
MISTGTEKKSLAFLFLFKEINALKRQLKPKNIASSKKRKAESILSLLFLFEEINALKRQLQLKAEKTARSKKSKGECILFTEISLTTSSDEGEDREYLITSSKLFSSSKTNLAKTPHPTINH